MNAASWLAEPWVHRLGWTLIQFLWQGAVIAVAFAAVRATVGRSLSSRGRYVLACATLALMTLAPILTFMAGAGVGNASARWFVPATSAWDSVMPALVAVWLAGVLVFSIRLLGGWLAARRLRTVGVRSAPAEWQEMFDRLVRRLDIPQRVRLFVSSRVDVPVVVGWLRPVVLVPVGALTGLPPEYVTALLAHELAHVCRRDYLVNLLQRVAEALLFYHPAVWWVSNQIRVEREMCCDDIAVAAQGDRIVYARALAELDASRAAWRALELAADGPSLLDRVRRLLGHSLSPWQLLPGPGGLATIVVLWLVGVVAATARSDQPGADVQELTAGATSVGTSTPSTASEFLTTALLGPIGPPQAAQSSRPAAPAPGRVGAVDSGGKPSRDDQEQTTVIRGRITSAATGLPLRNARVRLSPRSASAEQGLTAITDDDGRYELSGVTPGRYDVSAEKAGFVAGSYGSRSPLTPGKLLEATGGQALEKIDMALPAGGVITGVVLDAAGDPLAGVVVGARMPEFVNGVPRPTAFEIASDVTDDLGRYRLFGLEMDTYFLSGSLRNPRSSGGSDPSPASPTVFYPGTTRLTEARPVRVEVGRELSAPPFTIVPARASKVSGFVTRQDGKPLGDVTVLLQLLGTTLPVHGPRAEVVNGMFVFPRVAPGEYTLNARSDEDGGALATSTLMVDGTDLTVPLVLRRTSTLRGRVTFDGNAAPGSAAQSSTFVSLRDEGGGFAPITPVRTDGSFEITGLSGRKRFDVDLPSGWGLKSMRAGGQDLMEAPLEFDGHDIDNVEVRLTQRVTVIGGRVSGLQRDSRQAVVLIFPEDPDRWPARSSYRMTLAPIDEDGRYRAEGLVPGRYLAVALESFTRADLNGLERFASDATAVTIAEGEQRALDLRLVSQ